MGKISLKWDKRKSVMALGGVVLLVSVAMVAGVDYLTILKGLIGLPVLVVLPGWIWVGVFFPKEEGIIEKLALSWMLSIVLVGWAVYGLRYLYFEKITNVTIIMALTLVVGLGLVLKFIKKRNEQ